ncbi:hypothetical protein H8K47_11030 [Undibacterium sp. CY7W]|uniref:LysM domain-containing protein n=1 Tax=Undibacterium rugosum TaxID=2762291 RepID=A0A923I158_9BURK|nr:hypothetical protein [Undibacterium rugosum]MBC3935894.1 hypothetical protein [Undibacterium rugosum]
MVQIAVDSFGNALSTSLTQANSTNASNQSDAETARLNRYEENARAQEAAQAQQADSGHSTATGNSGSRLSFAEDVAARSKEFLNKLGITRPVQATAIATDEQVGSGLNDRNGSDVASDQYDQEHGMGPARSVTVHNVSKGDNLEKIAKNIYGDQWLAGMALMIRDNNLRLNEYGSPIIRPGQSLNAWDTSVYSEECMQRLSQAGGAILGNNSKGLAYKAAMEAQVIAQAVADERYREENRYAAMIQGNRPGAASANAQPQMVERATYDAMGNVTGSEMVPVDNRPAMGYVEQMGRLSHALEVKQGFVKNSYDMATQGLTNSNNSWTERGINFVAATAMFGG